MRQISRTTALAITVLASGVLVSGAAWREARGQAIKSIGAGVVATNIPGASAIAQIGQFVPVSGGNLVPGNCPNPSPIPTKFSGYTLPGQVLDPNRILVGSTSNFGAPLAVGVGQEGSFLSIDPSGPNVLKMPPDFALSGDQASTLNGAVQMFSANSPPLAQ